jgi:hypothetical protein
LIGSDVDRCLKIRDAARTTETTGSVHSSRGDEVVLIDTVPANTQATDKLAISIKRQASGKKDDAAHVIGVGHPIDFRVRSLRTWVRRVIQI